MSNIAEFAEIPEYSVTDNMTLEDVNNLVTEIYTRNYKAVTLGMALQKLSTVTS